MPDRLKELQAKFAEEAKKYDVFPLDPRLWERFDPKLRVSGEPQTRWTYYGNSVRLPEPVGPQLFPRAHTVTAEPSTPNAPVIAMAYGLTDISGLTPLFPTDYDRYLRLVDDYEIDDSKRTVAVTESGIGWLWAALGVMFIARLGPLLRRFRRGEWAVLGADHP